MNRPECDFRAGGSRGERRQACQYGPRQGGPHRKLGRGGWMDYAGSSGGPRQATLESRPR
ncbi:hypothetical protein CSIRO_2228 [Bradyrhizobiaceae bacterium SG-6C]|nr:hypothetical protein CSIRO_2228 [Bradyrhizobiaceae bacterium SG-6C]